MYIWLTFNAACFCIVEGNQQKIHALKQHLNISVITGDQTVAPFTVKQNHGPLLHRSAHIKKWTCNIIGLCWQGCLHLRLKKIFKMEAIHTGGFSKQVVDDSSPNTRSWQKALLVLTNELFVPYVQGHISESGGYGTHHFVIVYPQ